MLIKRPPIEWSEIVAFLERQEPGCTASIAGAMPTQIAALEQRSPVPLPENYIGFLRTFGGARGGFNILTEHGYLADELLSIPEELYIWDRRHYLLIGMLDATPRLDDHELFLDLYRADARDALVVGFTPRDNPSAYDLECGISDCVLVRAMGRLAIERAAVWAQRSVSLVSHPDAAWTTQQVRDTAEVLTRLGFVRCLPWTPYTWCG